MTLLSSAVSLYFFFSYCNGDMLIGIWDLLYDKEDGDGCVDNSRIWT
jgi:hypothetical protein